MTWGSSYFDISTFELRKMTTVYESGIGQNNNGHKDLRFETRNRASTDSHLQLDKKKINNRSSFLVSFSKIFPWNPVLLNRTRRLQIVFAWSQLLEPQFQSSITVSAQACVFFQQPFIALELPHRNICSYGQGIKLLSSLCFISPCRWQA